MRREWYGTILVMNRVLLVFMIAFSLCGVFSIAQAQFNQTPENVVNVKMTPENPGPDQTVQVQLESYSTDLNKASIVWKVNGGNTQSGTGKTTFTFTTGKAGSQTTLDIVIQPINGNVITKTLSFQPATVDLIWQSESFVPPFYRGKALFSHQNKISFIAIPHIIGVDGQEIPAKNLVYTWTRNGSALPDFSGYGMNTYTMIASVISRPLDVSVEVSSKDASGVAFGQVVVSPQDPEVIMYQKHPLYGTKFEKAIRNTYTMDTSNEMELIAMPYFFGTQNLSNGELAFVWNLNGNQIPVDSGQRNQIFRQKEGTSGTSRIGVSISHATKILQSASMSFNLQFVIPTNIRNNF